MIEVHAANDNVRSAADLEIIAEVRIRRIIADRAAAPTKELKRMIARISSRQTVGGEGPVAANDNQAWPLAQWLRKDGNEVLLRVAERYRAMYDAAHTETPLVGSVPDDLFNVEQKHSVNRKSGILKVNGAKSGVNGPLVDDGTYKVIPINDDVRAAIQSGVATFPMRPKTPSARKWNGDRLLIAAIDSRVGLHRLQSKLGPLLETFEDAVLHGETLRAIGEAKGIGQHAPGAGRVLVMMGLEVVQTELSIMDREERAA